MIVTLNLPSGKERKIAFDNIMDARIFEAIRDCFDNSKIRYVDLCEAIERISKEGIPQETN